MKKVSLTIKTVQKPTGEAPLDMEFITIGSLSTKQGATYILYEETETTGLKGHKTSLKIEPESVKMIRLGEHPIQMNFVLGQREVTQYKTPYGNIKMEYLTNTLDIDKTKDSGRIYIKYDMSLKGLQEAVNSLEINYCVLND